MTGSGRGAITADGCAVELYRLLPARGEAGIVHDLVPSGGSVLDLGCGVGRIAHGLVALGHPVTGVDSSADMLGHVRGAETVCAPIAGLELGRTFDAVLVASHLVNTADDDPRTEILASAARHLAPGGVLVAERHPPEWFDSVSDDDAGYLDGIRVELTGVQRRGDLLDATVRYTIGDDVWTQTFTARRLDDEALHRELRGAGLSFERWCDDGRSWFAARRTT